MLFLEKKFASIFIPAFAKGDKDFLATLPGVEIFDDSERPGRSLGPEKNVHISNGIATIGVFSILGDGLPFWVSHTSYTSIIEGVRIAEADESVEKIVLEIDSPGGFVFGWMPAALAILNAEKPVTAVVGNLAASAAYMLASQADEIIARDNLTTLGSIGVASEHMDFTRFFEDMGIDIHTFTNKESKAKRPDLSTEEGRAIIQKEIQDVYNEIEIMIAAGREVTIEFLRENFGAGRVMLAKEALSAKMVNEIKQKDLLSNESLSGGDEIQQENETMNISQLKAEHPDLFKQVSDSAAQAAATTAKAEGVEEGKQIEKKRVAKWASFVDVDNEACVAGIKGDADLDEVTMAQYAAKQVNAGRLKDMSTENGDENGNDISVGDIDDDETQSQASKTFEAELDAELAKNL